MEMRAKINFEAALINSFIKTIKLLHVMSKIRLQQAPPCKAL